MNRGLSKGRASIHTNPQSDNGIGDGKYRSLSTEAPSLNATSASTPATGMGKLWGIKVRRQVRGRVWVRNVRRRMKPPQPHEKEIG